MANIEELKEQVASMVQQANETENVADWCSYLSAVEDLEDKILELDPTYKSVIEDGGGHLA
jgi:hypothetical protein